MQKDKIKRVLRYVVPFIAFMLIFSFALACGGGEPPTEEISKPGEEGGAEVKETEKVEEAKTKEVAEIEEKKIIGYKDTELKGKVPAVEWEIGEPIDYPNGLRFILNKVWIENQEGYFFVVINETLINTTDEVQDGYDLELPVCVWVWDSEDNRFSGNGSLTGDETIWERIDSLSPGDNKKWPPGKELNGNVYFDVIGNTGGLMVELEYAKFIRPNVIYRYVLEDTEE